MGQIAVATQRAVVCPEMTALPDQLLADQSKPVGDRAVIAIVTREDVTVMVTSGAVANAVGKVTVPLTEALLASVP